MKTIYYQKYKNKLSFRNKMGRFLWGGIYLLTFRPFAWPCFNSWRLFILRLFGTKIGAGSKIHASIRIWAPWNLEIGQRTALGPFVECYNPGKIIIGNKVTISQRSHLCAASHNYTLLDNPLITGSIIINDYAWVGADAFVGMGITVGEGSVVGARSVVIKNVDSWCVVAGNPARFIKDRKLE